jgi:RimJ/RimL family protein N-acetyltransferase
MRPATLAAQDDKRMMPPLKAGATLPLPGWPGIETERLILRQWRGSDVAANMAMLGDPESARFITADRKPVTETMAGWRNAAIMAGHWALHGFGMFVVEEKSSGKFAGRAGPFYPPVWPGFEVGWGTAPEFRGKGYAVEATRASIDWSFATFELDQIVHCIDPENVASQAVARRLGAVKEGVTTLLTHPCDLWVTYRSEWRG